MRGILGNARLGPRGQPLEHTPAEGIQHLAAGGLSQPYFHIARDLQGLPNMAPSSCGHVALHPPGPCPASPPRRQAPYPAGPASFLYHPHAGSAQEAGRGLAHCPKEGLPGAKPEGEKAGWESVTSPRDSELPGKTSRAGDDQTEASPPAGCRPPRPSGPRSPGPCRCPPDLGASQAAALVPQAGARWRASWAAHRPCGPCRRRPRG